jgi:nascent polypeptide-associated complex subunit alpha
MFPKISPKQLEKIARQIGMQMENIDAERVIIECSNREIIITNPQVSKIKMQNQESFQIIGEVEEKNKVSEEDVEIVAQKANISREEAKKLLEETGDIVLAIKKARK